MPKKHYDRSVNLNMPKPTPAFVLLLTNCSITSTREINPTRAKALVVTIQAVYTAHERY